MNFCYVGYHPGSPPAPIQGQLGQESWYKEPLVKDQGLGVSPRFLYMELATCPVWAGPSVNLLKIGDSLLYGGLERSCGVIWVIGRHAL